VYKFSFFLLLTLALVAWGCQENPTQSTRVDSDQEGPCPAEGDSVAYTQPPQIISFTTPPYPDSSIQAGHCGIVGINILVGRLGTVQDVVVRNSCGHHELDELVRTYAYQNVYLPGRNGLTSVCMWLPCVVSFDPQHTPNVRLLN
jgi:TonB family protein